MTQWKMKTCVHVGTDALRQLEKIKDKKVCLVCDPFLIGSENLQKIKGFLENNNQLQVFSDVVPDPPIEKVALGVVEMAQFDPDVVIGIGGGSAIDQAKGISFVYKKISQSSKRVVCIAIPTTSGTGSEVTNIFVLSDTKEQRKYPIIDDSVAPDMALLDETLVVSCPPTVTAYSGIDVLTHALEAIVALNANTYTDSLAQKATTLVFDNLKECFTNGSNLQARANMHQASCLAGFAFTDAGLGICHALSHQVGAIFHLPHGMTNAILLASVIEYNAQEESVRAKYAEAARAACIAGSNISDTLAVQKLIKQIRQLQRELSCPNTLRQAGISHEDARQSADKIVFDAMQDMTFRSNPVQADEKALKKIYLKII